jgi:GTP-binding protein
MFVDEAVIKVESGKGGDGIVHFRREKYVNRGGPDGGDGGKGGDVVLRVNRHLNTLEKFRHQKLFKAENGKRGGVKNQTGRSAQNLIIDVPPGTIVREAGNGGQIVDLIEENKEVIICPGGRGGRGNTRFANPHSQAPRLAEKGAPGYEKELHLELKLIADVGIIGMPNAGKSSLLASVTNAKPKIADYPFTTLIPNLGVAVLDEEITIILADIPGLIEGAHTGMGLGDTFLKHIQRTKVLIHLLDGLSQDQMADFAQINTELSLFDPDLGKKPQVVAINKIDLPDVHEKLENIKKVFKEKGIEIFVVSTVSHENTKKLLWRAKKLLDELPDIQKEVSLPVYNPESKERAFEIIKTDKGWVIKGGAIERAAEMTYWEYFESVRRFHRILESMGIGDALRKSGIREGDSVYICDHEFEWVYELDNT